MSKLLYEYVASGKLGTLYPPEFRGLAGTVDPHVHVGYGAHDPIALAKHASRAGMRALLFKMVEYPSVEVARITSEVIEEWAHHEGITPVTCFGGVVLNSHLGGLNLDLVRLTTRAGGRAVWFPTSSSANHLAKTRGVSLSELKGAGLYLLDSGKLLPNVREIVKYAVDNDLILSFGHASRDEIIGLAEEVYALGFKKAVLDHPLSSVIALGEEDLEEICKLGVHLNFTYFELSPVEGVDPQRMVDLIRKVGPEKVLLSSDVSLPISPDPVECLRLMTMFMKFLGLDDEWVKKMNTTNARRLLNIS